MRLARSGPLRDVEASRNRGTCDERLEHSRDVAEIPDPDEIGRRVEADQVAYPGEGGHVGDGVVVAHDPGAVRKLPVEDGEEALRLRDIAVARALVLEIL